MGPFLKSHEVRRATYPGLRTRDYGLSAGRRRLFRHAGGLRGDAGVSGAIARSSPRASGCKDRGNLAREGLLFACTGANGSHSY